MNIIIERTIELNAPLLTEPLPGSLFTTEEKAHQFLIACTQSGAPVTLSGTVSAKFIREANNTTILMSGSISGGKASLILPADCYNISGRFDLTIFVTSNNVTTCIYSATGSVKAAQDGTLVDEGTVVPSIEQLQQDVTNLQNNKVNRAGDTMTGALNMPVARVYNTSYPTLAFRTAENGSNIASIGVGVNDNTMAFIQKSPDTSHSENYYLPSPASGLTSDKYYNILTSKTPVTVAQGGTGLSGLTSPTLTPGSNVVITANNLVRFGPMIALNFVVTVNSDLATGATIATIGNIDDSTGGSIAYLCAFRLDGTFKTFIKVKDSKNIIANAAIPAGIWYVNACIVV